MKMNRWFWPLFICILCIIMHWFIIYNALSRCISRFIMIFQYSLATFLCRRVLLRFGNLISRGDELEGNGISNGYVVGEWEYAGNINRIGSTIAVMIPDKWKRSAKFRIFMDIRMQPKGMSSQARAWLKFTKYIEVFSLLNSVLQSLFGT